MNVQRFAGLFNRAIELNSTILVKYSDSKGVVTGREVEPYKMGIENNQDIFWGYDTRFNGIRKFFINRISYAFITNRKFEPRWPVEKIDMSTWGK